MTTAKSDGFWRLVRERAFDMLDDPVVLGVEQAGAPRPQLEEAREQICADADGWSYASRPAAIESG
jgi:hypothetical protein